MSVHAEADGRRSAPVGSWRGVCLALALGPYFTVDSLTIDGKRAEYVKTADHLLIDLPPQAQTFALQLAYHGEVDSPGNHLVSEDETYVRMEAGWIPAIEGGRARSRVAVEAPAGQEVVVTGELVSRETSGTGATFVYDTLWPAEIPTLAMGCYQVTRRQVGDVEIAAYLTSAHSPQAGAYLDLAARAIGFYSTQFGPYPYHRYSIVECSFGGGYGPLTFCLINTHTFEAAKPPVEFLAHEISHVWWGGVVGTQGVESFLTEPLAEYSAYLFQEQSWTAAEARSARRNLLAEYLLARSASGIDAPVATATGEAGWAIRHGLNYCKGALALHQLRRLVGPDTFFRILHTLAADCNHKNAGWPEFRAAAEKATGRDLQSFFDQWIQRADTPNFALAEQPSYDAGTHVLTLALEQSEPVCVFSLPVRIATDSGQTVAVDVAMDSKAKTVTIPCPDPPRSVALDPDDEVLKILASADIPLGPRNALTEGAKTYVIYASGSAGEIQSYHAVAEQIAARCSSPDDTEVKAESDLPESEWDKANVVLVAGPVESPALGHLFGWTGVEVGERGIAWRGIVYGEPDQAAIVSTRNPRDPTRLLALYTGNSLAALQSIAGKDPGPANLAIFASGALVLTADFPRVASGHWYEFEPR
jgi:aminopeptidase N